MPTPTPVVTNRGRVTRTAWMPPPHPQEPSTNPEYANPRNEVWLDIRTGAAGAWIACVTLAAAAQQGFHPLG